MSSATVASYVPQLTPRATTISDGFAGAPRCDTEPLGETVMVAARQRIFLEGDRASYLYKVVGGAVRSFKSLECGRRQVTGLLFDGDYFGSHHSSLHHTTAEAITDSAIVRYRQAARHPFASATDTALQYANLMRDVALSELRKAEEQILLLGRMTSCSKVAAFLLHLSERAQSRGEPGNPVAIPMTRYDIADFLGLTAESVSRCLTRLKQAGMIEMELADEVALLDLDALADVPRGF